MSGDNAAFESEEYTVGWVCALPLEMAAARGMLDKIHPNLAQQEPDDHNSYILGEIQGHKIVIACLPAGIYGTNPAATVAKELLRTFKSIRFGLLVGIGGGAPSSQHDIRLGDVVISQPTGTFGGVVQHDRGKVLPRGGFERTGSHNAPPQSLLSALARLQATHMIEESKVPEFLSQLSVKSPKRMKGKFSYPGALHDRLYPAGYEHVKPESATCAECDETKIINREDRGDTDPYFHYGTIASGNQVIKDGKTRERLSQEYGALCFEMEAAGLFNFPCLVIRGICDYADSHKNKNWQEYAAATAAAFAKELLMFVPPNQVLQEKKLVSELMSIAKDQLETTAQSLNEQKQIRKILDGRPLDLHIVHNARCDSEDVKRSPRCEPGTRARILELIQNWADQDSGLPLLWLIGPAGTDTIPCFKESLWDSLEGLDKDAVDKSSLENQFQKLLWDPLESLKLKEANHLSRIIIIDALDECERPESLIRLLGLFSKLCTSSKLHLRVLITSRYAPEIVEAFEPLLQNKTVHTLELHREFSGDTTLDIRNFLEARFSDIKYKRRVQKDPWPTTDDLDRLVELSTTPEPLFIYAATLCRFVSDKNRGPIQQLIMWLEQGSKSQLHQIYNPILDQAFLGFDEEEFRHKLQFLGTVVLLARPLSAKSLTLLLRTDLDDISWWVPRLYAVLHVPPELYQPIQLLHKSFSDFLTSDEDSGCNKYRINTVEIHANLAAACIQCMEAKLRQDICGVQKSGITKDEIDANLIHSCIPAELEYACTYWFLHLKRSDRSLSSFTYTFLYDHLLHWIEVLSLLGRLADGVSILRELLEMKLAPLQIYGSSIFFSPTGSIVRRRFWHQRIPKTGEIHGVDVHWSARLQVIQNPGRTITALKHDHPVDAIAFSPCGRIIASSAREKIQLWDLETGASEITLIEDGAVTALAFTLDGSTLASPQHLWDTTKPQEHQTSGGDSQCITGIVLSPDGKLLASASRDKTMGIWDTSTLVRRWTFVWDEKDIHELSFSLDSKLLASLSKDNQLCIWSIMSGARQEEFPCSVSDVAYSSDGQIVASTYWIAFGGEVAVWEAATGRNLRILEGTRTLAQGKETVLSEEKKLRILSGGQSATIAKPEPAVLSPPPELMYNTGRYSCPTFSHDGHKVAAIRSTGLLGLWELSTGGERQWCPTASGVRKILFSPDSQLIAALGHSEVFLCPITGSTAPQILGIEAKTAEFFPDGNSLVVAGSEVTVWDLATSSRQHTLGGLEGSPMALCVSSDGRMIAVSSDDQFIRVWNVTSRPMTHFTLSQKETVTTIAFSPDGKFLATASERGVIRLWDTSSGTQLSWAIRPEGFIRAIKVVPNELLVSVSDLPPFFNLWNDMKLRVHRYQTISATTEKLSERVPYDIGLIYDGNWITQGSENLLWVPPQYRPLDGSAKGWVSGKSTTIFIGSVSGHVIKFQSVRAFDGAT
ncbi:G-protein beta WD-40 repeat-containing protein [Fusarium sp. NRRL 52700]|nr:G-protein beta WD-40 repeat-containing protein [Fusarium sp. NRRL 52700]